MLHFGLIRKYTAALLDLFSTLEIQYNDSNGNTLSRNIPIKYSVREKSKLFDELTTEQLLTGNYNVLPRGALSLVSMIRTDERIMNKNMKINTLKTDSAINYMYNSVPYEFLFDLDIHCRGMNEAAMIIEQIAPRFNPFIALDIYEIDGLDTPTSCPVKILDMSIDSQEYEELSQNIITVTISFSLMGNFYPPVKSLPLIKEFKMLINQGLTDPLTTNNFSRKAIIGFDVINGNLENETLYEDNLNTQPPVIIDMVANNFSIGTNLLTVIWSDKDNVISEESFNWELISGSGILSGSGQTAELTITAAGSYEVQVTITDMFGNYTTLSKTFVV